MKKTLLSLLFFLIIFNPPLLPIISFTKIFTAISLIYCALYNRKAFSMIWGNYHIRRYLKVFFVLYAYYFLVSMFSSVIYSWPNSPALEFVNSVVSVVSLFSVSMFLCMVVFKKEGYEELIGYMIKAAVIEAILSISAFIIPTVKLFFNELTIANSNSSVVVSATGNAFFRNYGLASTLFDSFGFGMAIIAIMALYRALNGKLINFLYYAMIAFAGCINARTTIVLIGIGTVVIVLAKKTKTPKTIIWKLLMILSMLFVVGLAYLYLQSGQANAMWLSEGISDIKMLIFNQEKTGIFLALSSELYISDDPVILLFGSGLIPAQAIMKTTDVGYIQNLWKFGIIGSAMLYLFFTYPFCKWMKHNCEERALAMALLIVVFVFFMKLNLWGYGISTIVLFTVVLGRLYTLDGK